MLFSLERELDLMTKYSITAEELFVILLIFNAQEGHKEFLLRYFTEGTPEKDLREILLSLQNKGIITKSYKIPEKGSYFNPEDVTFNKTVLNQFIQHSQDYGMELFMAYPTTTFINGKEFSLRNISKNFHSLDEFCWAYGRAIKFNYDKHKEILDLLEWGKENNLINSGICDFVISMKWIELAQLKDENEHTLNDTSRVL